MCYEKKKKKNNERAIALKHNIIKHNKLVKLPNKNNITFIKTNVINGIHTENYPSKNDLIKKSNLKLQTDDLINGRKEKDVLIKTYRILLLPTKEQKKHLMIWMDIWIEMYNKVISIIKNERKKQSDKINKSLRYNQMNLNNLNLNKLKKDLHQFKKDLIKNTKIDSHTLDYCINDVLTILKSSITNLRNANTKKSKLRYIKKLKKVKYLKLKIIVHQ